MVSPVAHPVSRLWPVVRTGVGLLLLVAAGLKLAGLGVSAVPAVAWFATPTVQILVAEWEIVLGIWLLSGAYPIGAWLAALATFGAFAMISGYLGAIGVASCGCFGAIKASPWWSFGVDAAVLLALVGLAKPCTTRHLRKWVRSGSGIDLAGIFRSVGIACAVGMVLTGIVFFTRSEDSTLDDVLVRLRGERVVIRVAAIGVGKESGIANDWKIEVWNRTDQPMRIVGTSQDCWWKVVDRLPWHVEPGQRRLFSIQVHENTEKGTTRSRRLRFTTDCPEQPAVFLTR